MTALNKHKMEMALKNSDDWFRALYEESSSMYFTLDTEGKILSVNQFGAEQLGYAVKEIVGQSILTLFHKDDRKAVRQRLNACQMTPRQVSQHEFRKIKKDKTVLWTKDVVRTVKDVKGKIIVLIVCKDITEQKQAEDKLFHYQNQLRSLASELSLTEERERRRIAAEIHDQIGQTLAICRIKLGELRESTSSTGLIKSLDDVRELIDQAIAETRSLIFELSSPLLYVLGLESAISQLSEQIHTQHNIMVDFEDDKQPKHLDDNVKILLFRSVRELLLNIVKHSKASNAKVSILKNGENVQINVKDKGVGFDISKIISHIGQTGRFGLFSIRERLDHLGGYLKIKSRPGHGTCVTMMVPLKKDEESTKGEPK